MPGIRDSLKAGLQLPDKLETYHKLTAAINRAKDAGDIQTLREIAEDPHGFIQRQGWATLDFSDEAELAQLRRRQVLITTFKPGVLDELPAERK